MAISWAPLDGMLRRRGQPSGLDRRCDHRHSPSAVPDETLTSLPGFSTPNRTYPLATYARGGAAHLVLGAVIGAVSETVWALTGRCPTTLPSLASDIDRFYTRSMQ